MKTGVAAIFLSLGSGSLADAQPVLVVCAGGPTKASLARCEAYAALLEKALVSATTLSPIDAEGAARFLALRWRPAPPIRADAEIDNARAAADLALRLFYGGNHQGAEQEARRARAGLSMLPRLERPDDRATLLRAYMAELLLLIAAKRHADAAFFAQAIARSLPREPLLDRDWPAQAVRLVSEARKRYEAAATGPVVRTDPPGAEVFIDGAPYGPSPVTAWVPPGEHRIMSIHGGTRSREYVIRTDRWPEITIDFELEQVMTHGARIAWITDRWRNRWAATLCALADVPMVIVLEVGDRLRATAVSAGGRRAASVEIPAVGAAAGGLSHLPVALVRNLAVHESSAPWWRAPGPWSLIAAGVVLGVTAFFVSDPRPGAARTAGQVLTGFSVATAAAGLTWFLVRGARRGSGAVSLTAGPSGASMTLSW